MKYKEFPEPEVLFTENGTMYLHKVIGICEVIVILVQDINGEQDVIPILLNLQ